MTKCEFCNSEIRSHPEQGGIQYYCVNQDCKHGWYEMTKTVWKYVLKNAVGISQVIDLPKGASPLRVSFQVDDLCVWFCVVPGETERRLFQFTATGQDIPMSARYIGSATHYRTGTEWHVWEV